MCFLDAKGEGAASGGADGRVCLWDLMAQVCTHTLQGHAGPVRCVAANGAWPPVLYSGSTDAMVRVWDPLQGMCIATARGHTEMVMTVAVTSQGELVSAGADNTIRIWASPTDDATAGAPTTNEACSLECVRTLEGGHLDCINSLGVMPDGAVVSGSSDCTVCMWDTSTAEKLERLDGHVAAVTSVCMDKGGYMVVSASEDGTVRRWVLSSKPSPFERSSSSIHQSTVIERQSVASRARTSCAVVCFLLTPIDPHPTCPSACSG